VNSVLAELTPIRRSGPRHASIGGRGYLSGALETVTIGRPYHWDGLRRGGDPNHPSWLFQYSLEGRGIFQSDQKESRIEPGQAFCATIPSSHRYHGDPTCPRWTFFWLMINEPYVTRRLLGHPNLHNAPLKLDPGSPLIRSAVVLLLQLVQGKSLDIYQLEEHLFRWMLECQRWADQQRYPIAPKARLLDFARHQTLSHLETKTTGGDLARAFGLDRSSFSHHFRKTTGHTPAAYARSIRLEEAAHLLRNSSRSVKEIAALTGFTSSNQLCKSFRRHFKMSPGSYRTIYQARKPPRWLQRGDDI